MVKLIQTLGDLEEFLAHYDHETVYEEWHQVFSTLFPRRSCMPTILKRAEKLANRYYCDTVYVNGSDWRNGGGGDAWLYLMRTQKKTSPYR